MFGEILENVRCQSPLIHNITNYVTVNDCANILLACNASPIMADELEDALEITALCDGLNINIGTLNSRTIPAMFAAGKRANELGHPVVLDPVGAGASALRTQTALDLLNEVDFTVVRGNISEIRTLAAGSGKTHGVDASEAEKIHEETLEKTIAFARDLAKEAQTIIAITGPVDIISNDTRTFVIRNGRPEMASITGTGCQLSALTAAFIAANPRQPLEAVAAAVCATGVCGELAWKRMSELDGNSSYRNFIIDAMYRLTPKQLEQGARYEVR